MGLFVRAASADKIFDAFAKLERYLQVLKAREGVLYLVPSKPQENMMSLAVLREIGNREVTLCIVAPPSAIVNCDEVLAWPGWKPGPVGGDQ